MTAASFEAALAQFGVAESTLAPSERQALDRDGFTVLRGVLGARRCEELAETFERKYLPADKWPWPRGPGTRHALLEHEPDVWRACLAPRILAAVSHVLGRRFFLAGVEGRDPSPDGGYQNLHRDWIAPEGPAPMAAVLAYLDPFGPANGATRTLPGSHRLAGGPDAYQAFGPHHPEQAVVAGEAGDVLVMDGYLAHSGTRNASGAPRRTLQICFRAIEERATHVEQRNLDAAPALLRYLLGQDN